MDKRFELCRVLLSRGTLLYGNSIEASSEAKTHNVTKNDPVY